MILERCEDTEIVRCQDGRFRFKIIGRRHERMDGVAATIETTLCARRKTRAVAGLKPREDATNDTRSNYTTCKYYYSILHIIYYY